MEKYIIYIWIKLLDFITDGNKLFVFKANIIQRFYAEVDQYFQEEPEKLVGRYQYFILNFHCLREV